MLYINDVSQISEIPDKWIEDYFKKSGDDCLRGEYFILSEFGFMTFHYDEEYLYLDNVYGDGKKWIEVIKQLKQQLNVDKVMFATRRNPKAFERKYKVKIVGYILELEV